MKASWRSLIVAAAALLPVAATSHAAIAQELKPLFRLGIDTGGDTLVEAQVVSGNTTTTERIRANQFVSVAGGVQWADAAKKMYAEMTVGWKVDGINATNQEFRFTRFPVEILGFHALPAAPWEGAVWRLGGGLTYHIHPELTSKGSLVNSSDRFNNALGVVLQTDILFAPGNITQLGLGLRYTALTYEVAATGQKFNADGVGLVLSLGF